MTDRGHPLFTVGFCGHRDIAPAEPEALGAAIEQVFRTLGEIAQELSRRSGSADSCGEDCATVRLLAGAAHGADEIALARMEQLGDHILQVVFPYIDEDRETPLTDTPDGWPGASPLEVGSETDKTILDGQSLENGVPFRSGHLEQAKWITRYSDLLVAVWNGAPPNGTGGTGDAIELAVRRGLPVVWIDPEQVGTVRFMDGNSLWENVSIHEVCSALKKGAGEEVYVPATKEVILRALERRVVPDWLSNRSLHNLAEDHPSDFTRLAHFLGFKPPTVFNRSHVEGPSELESWNIYQRVARDFPAKSPGGRLSWIYDAVTYRWSRPFQLLGLFWLWKKPAECGAGPLGTGVGKLPTASPDILKNEFRKADQISIDISRQHRSEQILLLALAAFAVFFGVLPSAKYLLDIKHVPFLDGHFKQVCVAIELAILVLMFYLWSSARKQNRHRYWADARRYAERLRTLTATWPLGFDVNDERYESPGTWSEWRTQSLIRSIGAPKGVMEPVRLKQGIREAWLFLVKGQISYHRRNGALMHNLHRRIEGTETALATVLAITLAAFLILSYMLGHVGDASKPSTRTEEVVLLMSAIFPAIGACCIALSAQLELVPGALRSDHLLARFREIDRELQQIVGNESEAMRNSDIIRGMALIRDAATLSLSDADAWKSELDRRKIIRGA